MEPFSSKRQNRDHCVASVNQVGWNVTLHWEDACPLACLPYSEGKAGRLTESSTRPHEPQPPFLSFAGFCENQKSHMKGLCLTVLSVRKLSLFTKKGIYCQIPQGLELRGVGSRVPGCGVGWGGGWRALEGLFQPVLSHTVSRTQVAFITAQRLFSGASLPSWTLIASPHWQALPSSSSRI